MMRVEAGVAFSGIPILSLRKSNPWAIGWFRLSKGTEVWYKCDIRLKDLVDHLQWGELGIHGVHKLGQMCGLRSWKGLFIGRCLCKAVCTGLHECGIAPRVKVPGKEKSRASLRLRCRPSIRVHIKQAGIERGTHTPFHPQKRFGSQLGKCLTLAVDDGQIVRGSGPSHLIELGLCGRKRVIICDVVPEQLSRCIGIQRLPHLHASFGH